MLKDNGLILQSPKDLIASRQRFTFPTQPSKVSWRDTPRRRASRASSFRHLGQDPAAGRFPTLSFRYLVCVCRRNLLRIHFAHGLRPAARRMKILSLGYTYDQTVTRRTVLRSLPTAVFLRAKGRLRKVCMNSIRGLKMLTMVTAIVDILKVSSPHKSNFSYYSLGLPA